MKLVGWVLGRLFSIKTLTYALKSNPRVIAVDVLYSEELLNMEASYYERSRHKLQRVIN
jgi:hypothetical protein